VKLTDISGKKKEYLKAQIDKLEIKSKIEKITDLHRGLNDFKKGCQPRTTVKNEKGDLVTDCHSILARWRSHFSQLLDVNHARRTEIHKAESLVPEPSAFEVELAVEKLKTQITRY